MHSLESIVLCVIFAILSRCNTFVEIHIFMMKHYDWLEKHIGFECGLPSISTIKRVIGFINPKELEQVCNESIKHFLINNKSLYRKDWFIVEDIKTLDGKTANSSDRKSSNDGKVSKMNAMSLYSLKNQLVEKTEFIEEKTNEISTGPELIKMTNVKDCIVVFDALNTQTETNKDNS